MNQIDDWPVTAGPGRVLSPRSATAAGIALALVLVALVVSALVATGGESDPPSRPSQEDVHVEVDPLTDRPVVDPCVASPDMCGDGAGAVGGPCNDASMCGQVTPGAEEQEINAESQPCDGELCGDIGPGQQDESGP